MGLANLALTVLIETFVMVYVVDEIRKIVQDKPDSISRRWRPEKKDTLILYPTLKTESENTSFFFITCFFI